MFNVEDFRSQVLNQSGVMKPNLFIVNFSFPSQLLQNVSDPSQTFTFLCEATSLPGVAFFSDNVVRRYGYGPTEKRPILPIFDDIPITFIGDGQGYVLKFFHNWMNFISNFDTSGSMQDTSTGVTSSMSSSIKPYEMRYKNEYIAQNVQIITFDTNENELIEVNLIHAFPLFVPPIPLSWSNNNTYMKIPTVFSYRDWYSRSYGASEFADPSNPLSFFSNLYSTINNDVSQISNTLQNTISSFSNLF